MARKKTPNARVRLKASLSSRLKEVRQELFGEHGGPELARRLNLPARTWYNYETGVTVPAEVLLSFIEQTGTNPEWLLTGEGPKYRQRIADEVLDELNPVELIRRGLEKLERVSGDVRLVAPDNLPSSTYSDFVAVGLVTLEDLRLGQFVPGGDGYILAYHTWIPHPESTVAVRLEDDAMDPILPAGSLAAVDRTERDVRQLHGQIVAAVAENRAMIRLVEISGRHVILRPNRNTADYPTIALELDGAGASAILGRVVWSWSRFQDS